MIRNPPVVDDDSSETSDEEDERVEVSWFHYLLVLSCAADHQYKVLNSGEMTILRPTGIRAVLST
jgi:hypothetical protein